MTGQKAKPALPEARLLLFARAPVPGRVCTRLQARLGVAGATELYRLLLARRLWQLRETAPMPVEIWLDGTPEDAFFAPWRAHFTWFRQEGADLGERMWRAVCSAAQRSRRQLLIGVDSPVLDAAYLSAALAELRTGRQAVLGPAEDGGYVLLALAKPAPELFFDIPWGTDRVAAVTGARLDALGWRWSRLPTLWDLDRPEDLPRLATLVPPLSSIPSPP